jgi:hypothetical protein
MEKRKNNQVVDYDEVLRRRTAKEKKNYSLPSNEIEEKNVIEILRGVLDELETGHMFHAIDTVEKNDDSQTKTSISNEKPDIIDNELCSVQCKELKKMKLKANTPIPKAIIVYLIGSSMAFAAFLTIFIITVSMKIVVLDLMSCIVGMISTAGLLATSIVAVKDWRKFVSNV